MRKMDEVTSFHDFPDRLVPVGAVELTSKEARDLFTHCITQNVSISKELNSVWYELSRNKAKEVYVVIKINK